MKLTHGDLVNLARRCQKEAELGQLCTAKQRIRHFRRQYPDAAVLAHSEGLMQLYEFGSGLEARAQFQAVIALDADNPPALEYLALLSESVDDYERRMEAYESREVPGRAADSPATELVSIMNQGANLAEAQVVLAEHLVERQEQRVGMACSLLEVALASGELPEEIDVRKKRAQLLRELDKRHTVHVERLQFRNPANNRIPLQAAVAEWRTVIALVPDDEMANNGLSACLILLRDGHCVEAAKKATTVATPGNVKPWLNYLSASLMMEAHDDLRLAVAGLRKVLPGVATSPADLRFAEKGLAEAEILFGGGDGGKERRRRVEGPDAGNAIDLFSQGIAERAQSFGQAQEGNSQRVASGAFARYPALRTAGKPKDVLPFLEEFLTDFVPEHALELLGWIVGIREELLPLLIMAELELAAGDPDLPLTEDVVHLLAAYVVIGRQVGEARRRYHQLRAMAIGAHAGGMRRIESRLEEISPQLLEAVQHPPKRKGAGFLIALAVFLGLIWWFLGR